MTARQGLGRGILGSQDLGHGHGAADGGREAGDLSTRAPWDAGGSAQRSLALESRGHRLDHGDLWH